MLPVETHVRYVPQKTARANFRDGRLVIKVPKHWPKVLQERAVHQLTHWGHQRWEELNRVRIEATGSVHTEAGLSALVARINAETFQVAVDKVRIGKAKYSRLAQANIRTRTLTFSRYAIDGLPDEALRYLIVHELAHFLEANHSRRFWMLVERHVPDWREQRRIARDFLEIKVRLGDRDAAPAAIPQQLSLL